MANGKTTVGSIVIGILTFGLLGFSLYSALLRLSVIQSNTFIMGFSIGIGAMIGLFMGIKIPIATEAISFAITSLIVVQGMWDITFDIVNGISDPRVLAAGLALSIFVLNIFTGRLKFGTAKKQIRRTIGTR